MSRPPRKKREQFDMRTPEEDDIAVVLRQQHQNRLRVDPLNQDPLAGVIGDVILNRSSPQNAELVGKLFVSIISKADPATFGQFARRVMAMIENVNAPHRHAFAFYAYSLYIEEAGKEPTKPQLKAYILARRETFKDAPDDEDAKGWTRLWKGAGLSTLAAR